MKTISPASFAMICFLILMQTGKGLNDKSPDYINEKISMLGGGFNAFSYLDVYNMNAVIAYCKDWKIKIPTVIQEEMDLQNKALENLHANGLDF